MIRGESVSLLVGALICVYFSATWLIDAPGSASEDQTAQWFLIDRIFVWTFRVIAGGLAIAGALASGGKAIAMLVATVFEAAFTLLAAAIGIETWLEARADGGSWDIFIIVFVILAFLSASGTARVWRLYRSSAGAGRMQGAGE